ncbi:MAG: GIY-YIG nuclease family protein [Methylobacterium sp.]|nr:GIY-YIG nuclease family protein [Methylobacterium sp.]
MPYAVYMLASDRDGTLYIGVTNDLARRVHEHRTKQNSGFTAAYGVTRLVWYETYDRILDAIAHEKALKKWRRDWKLSLIEELNPDWSDLYPALSLRRDFPRFIRECRGYGYRVRLRCPGMTEAEERSPTPPDSRTTRDRRSRRPDPRRSSPGAASARGR